MTAGCATPLIVSPGPAELTVAPPADNEGGVLVLTYSAASPRAPITRFEYKYWKEGQPQNEGRWEPILLSAPGEAAASSTAFEALDTSTHYTFQVRAVEGTGNNAGYSAPSAKISAITLANEMSAHDLSVENSTGHSEFYGVGERVIFRAIPVYNTATNTHHGIKLTADDVFSEMTYWDQDQGNRVPSDDVGIQVEVSDSFRVAVRFKLEGDADYETAGPDLSAASLTHLRVVIGEGDEYLSINLRQVEANPTEPYEAVVSDHAFRTAITRFFDRSNREGSNPFWIMVIDTRESIPVNITPSAHPTVTYFPADRSSGQTSVFDRGDEVVGVLSSTVGLNQFLDGPYYVWQARKTYGYGETWEFTVHHGTILTIPDDAEIGSEWRLCWMRHNLIEFPTTHITVKHTHAPVCTYSDDAPDRGDTVTASLSYEGSTISNFMWQMQTVAGTTWAFLTDETSHSFTIPSNAPHGTKYRFTWRRKEIVSGGFIRRDEAATSHITVRITGYGLPSEVRNLRVTRLANELRLDWDAPETTGGTALKYKVRYSGITATVSDRTYTLINLTNGTEYLVSVWAENEDGAGPATQITGVPGSVPFRLTGLNTIRGDHRITLRWDAGDGNGNAITGYEVRLDAGGTVLRIAASNTAYVFSGLTNGTTYTLYVRALNELGHSPWSSLTAAPVSGSGNVQNDHGALTIADITHVPAHGTYTIPETYDLGNVFIARAVVYMDAGAENTAAGTMVFDSEPGLFDDALGLFDGRTALAENDLIDAHAEIRFKDALGDSWGQWQRITAAYIQARYFQARIILSTDVAHLRPRVRVFRFRLSLKQRTEVGMIETAATDVVASYSKWFQAAPSLMVSSPDLQADEVIVVDNESAAEFHVRVQNASGTRRVRTVHWNATGYGERIQ